MRRRRLAGVCTKYSVLDISWSPTLLLAALFLLAKLAHGAPPRLDYFFPAGVQRGRSAAVAASGEFATWPVQVWADRPGLTATCDKDKGKLTIAAADDAIAGVYWLRLYDGEGASSPRPFVVGTLSEAVEIEPNDAPDKAQAVEPRVVMNGKLARSGDVDAFRLELKQGQTLVASLQANSILGSPMDAVLQICELVSRSRPPSGTSRRDGAALREGEAPARPAAPGPHEEPFVLAQNHDCLGLDPQVAFPVPHDGFYLVRLFAFPATPDSSIRFAGGDNYAYRLTLTTGPFIDHALPLAVPHEESQVELGGWNLNPPTAAVVPPRSADPDPLAPPDGPLAWIWHPAAAGAIALPRFDHAIVTRSASERVSRSHPSDIPIPATITGRLESPGQTDVFAFSAAKNQKLRVRVAARSLGFQTDAVISVRDDAGKLLAEQDDVGRDDRDPQLDFTAPSEGRYQLLVRDLFGRGENRLLYRLTIEPIAPDFSLSLAADSFVLDKDKPLEIPVNITVRDGLREAIEIQAIGLPPGVTAQPVRFQPTEDAPMPGSSGRRGRRGGGPQPSGPSVKLVVKADAGALAGGTPIRIEGRTLGPRPIIRTARFPLNLPLAGLHHAVWLTVRK